MFGDQITQLTVERNASQICSTLRSNLDDAVHFNNWLTAQSDADLTALGFDTRDISFLRAAFADLNDLAIKVAGGTGDGNHPTPYNYTTNVKEIIGPG